MNEVVECFSSEERSCAYKKKLTKGDFNLCIKEKEDQSLCEIFQQFNGKLGWGVKSAPIYSYVFAYLSQYNHRPSKRVYEVLLHALVYIQKRPHIMIFRKVKGGFKMRIWSDASYCRKLRLGHFGYVVQFVSVLDVIEDVCEKSWINVVDFKSKKTPQKVRSTASAEFHGLEEAVVNSFKYVNIFEKLHMSVQVEFVIDSSALRDQLKNKWMQTEYELQPQLDYIVERLDKMKASVHLVSTEYMLADDLTKFIPRLCSE